jgi:XapX domain-containing protein
MPQSVTIILLSLLTGFIVGVIFTAFKLPLPAPPALAGVMGILGIYLGHVAWPYITKLFS